MHLAVPPLPSAVAVELRSVLTKDEFDVNCFVLTTKDVIEGNSGKAPGDKQKVFLHNGGSSSVQWSAALPYNALWYCRGAYVNLNGIRLGGVLCLIFTTK